MYVTDEWLQTVQVTIFLAWLKRAWFYRLNILHVQHFACHFPDLIKDNPSSAYQQSWNFNIMAQTSVTWANSNIHSRLLFSVQTVHWRRRTRPLPSFFQIVESNRLFLLVPAAYLLLSCFCRPFLVLSAHTRVTPCPFLCHPDPCCYSILSSLSSSPQSSPICFLSIDKTLSFSLLSVIETTARFKLMLKSLFFLEKYLKEVQSQVHLTNISIW